MIFCIFKVILRLKMVASQLLIKSFCIFFPTLVFTWYNFKKTTSKLPVYDIGLKINLMCRNNRHSTMIQPENADKLQKDTT